METSQNYKILLIASEILIPVIILVGAYFIFRPVMKKKSEELEELDADMNGKDKK